jgi:hypothetical protein
MKKMMMTLAAVLCCAMTMTVFTACGSDDDNSKDGNGQKPQEEEEVEPGKLLSASSAFVVTSTGLDAIKAMSADGKVMIRYTYGNGAVETGEITSGTFKKAIDYSFDDKGNIVASMQVYINDINEEKVREIIGTQYMEVKMEGEIALKFENTTQKYAVRNYTNFKEFDRSEETKVDAAIKSLKHDKERHGVIPFATYGLKANDKSISSSSSWLGN